MGIDVGLDCKWVAEAASQ